MGNQGILTVGKGGHDVATHTRLRGRWLWAARIGWAVLFTLSIVLQVITVPVTFAELSTPCATAPCANNQLSPEVARSLQDQLGISLNMYAWYWSFALYPFSLVSILLALVIFWQKSADWMALFVSLMLATFAATSSPSADSLTRAQSFFLWPLALLRVISISSIVNVFFLFPDGRFVPRWARWLALLWLAVVVILVATGALFGNALPVMIGFASGAGAQVYRYRRASTPLQRQQTKWIVLGVSAMAAIIFFAFGPLWSLGYFHPTSVPRTLFVMVATPLLVVLPLQLIPASFAIAILRYRLWDVDFVISRSLVYGGLTVVLAAIFAGGFFGLQAAIRLIFGNEQAVLAAGISGATVVGLFAPTRRLVRSFVDSRIYHIHVDYRRTRTPTPSPVASSGILKTQLGAYEGLEPIGRGGMAEIYKARHPTLDKTVAVKVLPPSLAKQADFRRRFEREAKTVAGLKHPNIVQVFDFGETDGTYYMVMEYIAGRDLGDIIHEAAPLAGERVRAIVEDIAGALDYAHAQGLVHRDVKPSNVMVESITTTAPGGRNERAVLMDFGIARILTGGTRLTATGTMGTFDYISPEQIQEAKDVDGRADVYSLGIMAYQMLTGQLPFRSSNPGALLIAHMNQPAPNPRALWAEISEETAEAVLRALEKDPARRWPSAGQFAAALG